MALVRDERFNAGVIQFDPQTQPSLGTGFGVSNGAMWYDSVQNTFMGMVNGVASALGSTAGVQKANTISATDYGVKADTKWVTDASFSNGSGAVVITASDPPFTSADVGKVCFGTTYQGGSGSYAAYFLRMSAGTITSVTDATHATCSTTANGTGTGAFIWGTDDTAALAAAWNAAANNSGNFCKSLILPTGGMLTTTGQFNAATCHTGMILTTDKTMQIIGQGIRMTVIIPVVGNYNFNTSRGLNGSQFFGIEGLSWRDLTISGMGWGDTTAPANTSIAYIGADGYVANVDLDFWGSGDANLTGYSTSSGGTISYNINNSGGGSVGLNLASGTAHETQMSFICCNINSSVQNGGSSTWNDFGSGYVGNGCGGVTVNLAGSSTTNFYNTRYGSTCSSGSTTATSVSSTAVLNQWGGGCTTLPSGPATCLFVQSGASVFAQGARFFSSGAGAPVNAASGGKFFDQGGNTYTGTANVFATGTYFKPAPEGNCTSSAAPAVCGSAGAGSVNIAAAATTVTVNTTAVTAGSQIQVFEDSSLGTKLGVTCNTTTGRTYSVTTRTAGTSFVITASAAPATNPACLSYSIVN